jgi:PhzF family phenazine biosynthesis protein
MAQRIVQVDAFAERPFTGNPAGVCIMQHAADEAWMQNVALEMNLSETAFLYPEKDSYRLRWFTPVSEVKLCGHATLASAHVLYEDEYLSPDATARFQTLSGELRACRTGDRIELDFPAGQVEAVTPPGGLLEALGVTARYVGKSAFDYLIEVDSETTVKSLSPDFGRLAGLPVRGVIVTSRGLSGGYDFVSRFFAPAVGINEDPVTGSAHCVLGPYWAERLGKTKMVAYQVSARGGVVWVRLEGDRVRMVAPTAKQTAPATSSTVTGESISPNEKPRQIAPSSARMPHFTRLKLLIVSSHLGMAKRGIIPPPTIAIMSMMAMPEPDTDCSVLPSTDRNMVRPTKQKAAATMAARSPAGFDRRTPKTSTPSERISTASARQARKHARPLPARICIREMGARHRRKNVPRVLSETIETEKAAAQPIKPQRIAAGKVISHDE